jgi:hypothetical protein
MYRAAVLLGIGFVLVVSMAHAELQNVEVGGSIEIYGSWYTNFYESEAVSRIPNSWLTGRPIGPFGTDTTIRTYNRKGADGLAFIEQRTTLSIKADFSQNVSAFMEVDSIDNWGEDFRSPNYLTGADQRSNSIDDVEFYQSYIEARDVFGMPLQLRIGRQELMFGSNWLVGNNHWFDPLTYLSFDAIRATFKYDPFTVDAFAAKLRESMQSFGKGDTDFYGIYGTYAPSENLSVDAYWFFLRDGAKVQDTAGNIFQEWAEDVLGRDDYGHTQFHTLGARVAGTWGALDYEVEGAYQFGDAAGVGAGFTSFSGYGDDSAWYNTWAAHGTVGYALPLKFEPHIALGAQYYGGEDRRDISFLSWMNPFNKPRASVSFNRLFSDFENSYFLDGGAMSNYWLVSMAVSAKPTESIDVSFTTQYLGAVAPFDTPVMKRIGSYRLPVGWPFLSFINEKGASDLGWETILTGSYKYSEDLSFEAGWSHLFTGNALKDGAFVDQNGLGFFGGLDSDDADYFWLGSKITF